MIRFIGVFLLLVWVLTTPIEAAVFSPKKGIGGAATLEQLNQLGATWFYNWGPTMSYKSTSGIANWDPAYWQKWVPLFYGTSGGSGAASVMTQICANTNYCNGGYYLVGNEPDNPGGTEDGILGTNIDERVNANVVKYGEIIKAIKAKDSRAKIILLGLTSKNTDFINKFMAKWRTQWMGDGAIANLADAVSGWHFHIYSNVAECPTNDDLPVRFLNEINTAMQLNFGRTIPNQELWITEMGSLTVTSDAERTVLKERMKCLTNAYENSPVVNRYAWFYLGCNPNISAYTGCMGITWARYNLFYMTDDFSRSYINDLGSVYAGVPLRVSPTGVPPVTTGTPIPTVTLGPVATPTSTGVCSGQYFGLSQCQSNAAVVALKKVHPEGLCQLNPSLGPVDPTRPDAAINYWKWSFCWGSIVSPTSVPTGAAATPTPTITWRPCSFCDENQDGKVCLNDVEAGARACLNQPMTGNCPNYDMNGDGVVNILDVQRCAYCVSSDCPAVPTPTIGGGPTATLAPPSPTVTSGPTCPKKGTGDANCDGAVNIFDFGIWKVEFITKTGLSSDFNDDGKVTVVDFGIWKVGYLGSL